METSSYYVALEYYVKFNANWKGLESAKVNGTYDKAIARLALDFTYKTSPKKRWDVSKAELIGDMRIMCERIPKLNAFYTGLKGFAYLDKSGHYSALAGSYDNLLDILPNLPDKVAKGIQLEDVGSIVEFDGLSPTGFTTIDGEEIDVGCSPILFLINAIDVCIIADQLLN